MSEVASIKSVKYIRRYSWLVALFFFFQVIAFVLFVVLLSAKKSKERNSVEFESIKNATNSFVMFENER